MNRLANLRVGQFLEIGNGAIFGSMITYMRLVTGGNGAKISSISHSNGPILVGQLRESHGKMGNLQFQGSIKYIIIYAAKRVNY